VTTEKQDSPFWAAIDKSLKVLLTISSAGFVILDVFIIFSRMFYRYTLEWIEGDALIQVQRLLAGQALYVKPTVNYVPLIYPPIYFYFAAAIAKIMGLGFGALRLTSFLSTVICALVIFLIVKETTKSNFSAFLGIGVFAATFMLTGQWFDIARVDMLSNALVILAVYFVRERAQKRSILLDILGGIFFSLSILTKQQTLLIVIAVILYYAIFNWRAAARIFLSFGFTTAILFGLFWLTSEGWVSYYLITIPAAHVCVKFFYRPVLAYARFFHRRDYPYLFQHKSCAP
jgi:4-amino-4-deoxy-L-arabinose transferase-like glycosyltransferase